MAKDRMYGPASSVAEKQLDAAFSKLLVRVAPGTPTGATTLANYSGSVMMWCARVHNRVLGQLRRAPEKGMLFAHSRRFLNIDWPDLEIATWRSLRAKEQ